MDETWHAISGYEGRYQVSDRGRVTSYCRSSSGRLLSPWSFSSGYLGVTLRSHDGDSTTVSVHTIVLTEFVSPRPEGKQAAHLNGDRSDNRLTNLRWVTPVENARHRRRHGTHLVGEQLPWTKLAEDDVRRIRELHESGRSMRSIARQYAVTHKTIHLIIHGKTWSHVKRGPAV